MMQESSVFREVGFSCLSFVNRESVRFQVLTVVSMKMAVFWVVALCSLVDVYIHFRGDEGSKHL
jgi:hypothetical protein